MASRNGVRAEPIVDVGDIDSMSVKARECEIKLCDKEGCTRVAGHDEGDPPSKHVVADKRGRVLRVWPLPYAEEEQESA
jgi:hypothetical protein